MEEKKNTLRDHLANQRTFLSWIRTILGIMAFGFVVERFSFFTHQVAKFLAKMGLIGVPPEDTLGSYSFILGISIIALGTLLSPIAFFKYKEFEEEMSSSTYRRSLILDFFISLFAVLLGMALITYLILAARME